jgi:hypothetical protein
MFHLSLATLMIFHVSWAAWLVVIFCSVLGGIMVIRPVTFSYKGLRPGQNPYNPARLLQIRIGGYVFLFLAILTAISHLAGWIN